MRKTNAPTARFFLLEFDSPEGGRELYREALPPRTAFAAARQMAIDGLHPVVMRCEITAEQAKAFQPRIRRIGRPPLVR